MLKFMTEKMFNGIILLDGICFNKDNDIRNIDNVSLLFNNNPKGCFVIQDTNNRILGYIFSKIEGNLGFIGPLAVHPDYKNNDFATKLINASLNNLMEMGCKSIGLDLDSNFVDAIALFQQCGFRLGLPTLYYEKTFPYPNISSEHILNGNDVTDEMLYCFDRKFREDYSGYSLIKDIKEALSINPEKIIFYCDKNSICGFIFNLKEISPFVCSGFLKEGFSISKFLHAYGCLQNLCSDEQLILEINSRYSLNNELHKYGFKIKKVFTRMLHKNYTGIFNTVDDFGFVARPWLQ